MKKYLLAFTMTLLVLIGTFTVPVNASSISDLYDNTNYDRIYKDDDGNWHNVIEIYEPFIRNVYDPQLLLHYSIVYFDFSRELENITELSLNITEKNCMGYIFGFCIPGGKSTTENLVLYEGGNVGDLYQTDTRYGDYGVIYDGTLETVEVLKISYILTPEEVDSVMADIQQQFDDEVNAILNNDLLSPVLQQYYVNKLLEEYSEYNISYGEELNQVCNEEEGDDCSYTRPDVLSDIFSEFLKEFVLNDLPGYLLSFIKTDIGKIAIAIIAILLIANFFPVLVPVFSLIIKFILMLFKMLFFIIKFPFILFDEVFKSIKSVVVHE